MKKFLLVCALCMTFGMASDALGQGHYDRGEHQGSRHGVRRDRRELRRNIRRERRDDDRRHHRRGNGYYRRGAGSSSHPVFGHHNRNRNRN